MLNHHMIRSSFFAVISGLAFSADIVSDGPVDVPDEFGLGERLALVSWLREHNVAIVDASDLAGLRTTYRQVTRPHEATALQGDAALADDLKVKLWVRHNRSVPGSPSLEELKSLLSRLDAQAIAASEAQRAEAVREAQRAELAHKPHAPSSPTTNAANVPKPPLPALPQPADASQDETDPLPSAWSSVNSETGENYRHLCSEVVEPLQRRPGPRPAWHAKAMRFMKVTIARQVDPMMMEFLQTPYELLGQLKAAGCDDPGVLAIAAIYYSGGGEKDPDRLLATLESGGYSLRLQAVYARQLAASFYREMDAKQSDAHERYARMNRDLGIKLLHSNVSDPWLKSRLAQLLGQADANFYPKPFHLEWIATYVAEIDRCQGSTDAVDPWLAAMIRGQSELMLAWKARGNGYAASVTTAGWEGFKSHQEAARTHFETAWKLDPAQPFAATMRIVIAMGLTEGPDEVMTWFDRAVSVCPDHEPAYKMALMAFSSNWDSSTPLALKIGRRAVQPENFSSPAANNLIGALRGPKMASWKYWADVRTVLRGYIDSPTYAELRLWNLHRFAGFAFKHRQTDDLVLVIDELGDKFDLRLLKQIWPHSSDKIMTEYRKAKDAKK